MAITQRAFFPNLKVVLRDRTHAATRPSHVQPSRSHRNRPCQCVPECMNLKPFTWVAQSNHSNSMRQPNVSPVWAHKEAVVG
jgi:hypothetical protein